MFSIDKNAPLPKAVASRLTEPMKRLWCLLTRIRIVHTMNVEGNPREMTALLRLNGLLLTR